MTLKRAIFDMSSILWTCLRAGKDIEGGQKVLFKEKEVLINGAEFGYENCINMMLGVIRRLDIQPKDCVLVFEGLNSKAERRAVFPGYKADGGTAPEYYDQFAILRDRIKATFLGLGSNAFWQDNIEGDDVVAYLALNLEGERWIVSGDGDMTVLTDPANGINVLKSGDVNENPYGPFPHKYITLYKALCGDSSDGYGGAKGFGPKSFLDLYALWDDAGLDVMEDLIKTQSLRRLADEGDVAVFKPLQKVVDDAANVYLSWSLAKLRPEKINTMRRPLQSQAGMVKPQATFADERLRPYAGAVRLITADNYDKAMAFAKQHLVVSEFVALDIETSTPDESDEWLESMARATDNDADKVDVLGSELTGLSLTFGANTQYTYYLSVDHADTHNVTVDQVREFVEMIPKGTPVAIQFCGFELPILYMAWGEHWISDPEWHGFIPNAIDTKIMASYVDENVSAGLKQQSLLRLGYQQETYAEVTTMTGPLASLPQGGKIKTTGDDGVVTKQYKMRELSAKHVLGYGADDTICTAALFIYDRLIMELEKTWDAFMQVEQLPAYLTALAFVQGTPMDMARMRELETNDDVTYTKHWDVVRSWLIDHGWEGTKAPSYDAIDPMMIKEVFEYITGSELKINGKVTTVRTVNKYPPLIRQAAEQLGLDGADPQILANAVEEMNLAAINKLLERHCDGEPKLDINSPKKMRGLLYDVIKMPVRIINDVTRKETTDKPVLASAVKKHKRLQNGHDDVKLTEEEVEALRVKAKTDDTAIEFALLLDADVVPVEFLKALMELKKIDTRRKLFYRPYRFIQHWKDGNIHASLNQCAAVTRRYSASTPNLQQLPKKGDGVKFREIIVPHRKDAVICSIDFGGQELRLGAWQSQDPNMLSCYIGEEKTDLHSLTASGAMKLKWGDDFVIDLAGKANIPQTSPRAEYNLFCWALEQGAETELGKLAFDLRKGSKNSNFAAQFGASAAKVSIMEIMPLADAVVFLDARAARFPRYIAWSDDVRDKVKAQGYCTTLMGARRHLAGAIMGDDRITASKAERQGPNFEIQGSAGEQTKLGMARLWKSGALWKYGARFIAPIHDELVTSVAACDALEFIKIKHECMTVKYATMEVPVVGSISIGKNFGQQIECGDEYSVESINKALAKLSLLEEAHA